MSAVGNIVAFIVTRLEALTPSVYADHPFRKFMGDEKLTGGAMDAGQDRRFRVRTRKRPTTSQWWGSGCNEQRDELTVRVLYVSHQREDDLEGRLDSDREDIVLSLQETGVSWPAELVNIVATSGDEPESVTDGADIKAQTITFDLTYQQGSA